MSGYNVGDRVRCTGTIKDSNDTAIDPAVVKGWYRTPAEVVTTLTYGTDVALVKDSTGAYHFDLDVDVPGRYFYGFYSTGNGKASSADGVIIVGQSKRS